jgi:hypothetical protein
MSPKLWPLVRPLIVMDALPPGEVAAALADAFANCVTGKKATLSGLLGQRLRRGLRRARAAVPERRSPRGDAARAQRQCGAQPAQLLVNLLLHAVLCVSPVDECARLLDVLPHSRPDAEIGGVKMT